jgi:hypothetical protein
VPIIGKSKQRSKAILAKNQPFRPLRGNFSRCRMHILLYDHIIAGDNQIHSRGTSWPEN